VQCVVISDYTSTHVVFNYVNVSIAYKENIVGIALNNGSLLRNPYSKTPGTHQMSTHIGNTGKSVYLLCKLSLTHMLNDLFHTLC
jgi:hypothetical protein